MEYDRINPSHCRLAGNDLDQCAYLAEAGGARFGHAPKRHLSVEANQVGSAKQVAVAHCSLRGGTHHLDDAVQGGAETGLAMRKCTGYINSRRNPCHTLGRNSACTFGR